MGCPRIMFLQMKGTHMQHKYCDNRGQNEHWKHENHPGEERKKEMTEEYV